MLFGDSPRVLAIGAHPDDIEIGAGGFIYKSIKRHRAHVDFLILTHGVQHRDPKSKYKISERERESIDAAQILGFQDRTFRSADFTIAASIPSGTTLSERSSRSYRSGVPTILS